MQVNDKVEAHEGVAVPAGTFMVCKVVDTDAFGATTQQW